MAGEAHETSVATGYDGQGVETVARAHANAEIAAELFVSHATVKTHVSRLLMKLGARDRAQLVMIAYESGMVAPGAS